MTRHAPSEPQARRRRPTNRHRPAPTRVIRPKVDPRVWAEALRLAQRDVTRIEVRSTTEVVVHNTADRAAIRRADRGAAA